MPKNSIPDGWLDCPNNGNGLIVGKFMPTKTPLSSKYDRKLTFDQRFYPAGIFDKAKRNQEKIGLWIDLTNTNRYYDESEIRDKECIYSKLNCLGHGEAPSEHIVKKFIDIVHNYIVQNPLNCIVIHCTHGFNRTGFLIVCFLVERLKFKVGDAVELFAQLRPPGIYRDSLIKELFYRYGNWHTDVIPKCPPTPPWAANKENRRDRGRY